MALHGRAAHGVAYLLAGALATLSSLTPGSASQTTMTPTPNVAFGSNSNTPPSGVSALTFPLTAAQMQGVPGLQMTAPPTKPAGQSAPHTAAVSSGVSAQVAGTDYQWCGVNADTPPQEIVDLAASMKNNWQLIYAYVYNNIAVEPTGESTKGAFGTYLDQSGNSFDQSALLVSLLRAAGYQAQYVVGTATLTASQLGLPSIPKQLIIDAGGSASGTVPYAWVQVFVNNAWTTLDPANKTTAILNGTNLTSFLKPPGSNTSQQVAIQQALNGISGAYNSASVNDYGSLASFIGGSRIVHSYYPPTGVRSGGTPYVTLPTTGPNYRTGLTLSGGGASAIYLCTDQLYGHTLSFANNALLVDGLTVQTGFSDPVTITIWHPNAPTPWGQAVTETLTNLNSVISLAAGQVRNFRAAHDANILNALQSVGPVKGTNTALLAAGSSQLSQTAQLVNMLDQLAGTYMVNHHTVQILRANNSIDTPMTSTSIDQITSTPASGLSVVPQAVSYALSAAQSAQETIALGQAGATQPVSAATLLAGWPDSSTMSFVQATGGTLPSGYSGSSAQQIAALSSFHNAGFDLLVSTTPPPASAPLGFIAMNNSGTSEFVLSTASGVYKGAADVSGAVPGLGAAGSGGTAPEAGPSSVGLAVDTGSSAVTFAAPLISVGSAAPYKLEFDLLYSSASDAQVTANAGNLTGRPEAPGVANNFEIRATASSDGFPLVGSALAGPAMPGVSAAYYLLVNANAIAGYYANSGATSVPQYNAWANAVVGSWLIAASTNNVATITRGLSSSTFYKLPWNSVFVTAEPSGDQLTQPSGRFLLTSAHGDKLAFNIADGQVSSITSPTGVQTAFSYTSKQVGPAASSQAANFLNKISVGTHSLTFGYATQLSSTGTYLLQSIVDETGRTSHLTYGDCFGNIKITTSLPQLCGLTKPDWLSGQPSSYTLGYGQIGAGNSGPAVLLNSVNIVNAAQNGLAATTVSYDGARMAATGITNANNHKTAYYTAPDRSEVDGALNDASISSTYPVILASSELMFTDSVDPLGNLTALQYNYAGQLLQKVLPDTQPFCQLTYGYDAHGNLALTAIGQSHQCPQNPQAIATNTVWDQTWNKPHIVRNALGYVTTYTYDPNVGTLTSVLHPAVTYLGNSVQPTESFAYYGNGQLKTATAADGEVTCYNYSANVLDLSQVIVDCGSSPHFNLTTALGYDAVGNPNQIVSARGYTTGINYDLARRPVHENTPPIAAQGNGVWSTYQHYDLDGRLIETDKDPGTGQALVATKTTYDNAGNMLTQSLPTNTGTVRNTVYTYDADERPSTTTTPVSATVNQVKQIGYDGDSRLFQVFINGVGTETHIYNGDSLPTIVTDGLATLNAQGVPTSAAHTIRYAYDTYDRLVTTTYADGSTEQLTLNAGSQVTKTVSRNSVSTTFSYDAMGRVTSEADQSFPAPFTTTYDLAGRPLTVAYSGGTFTYSYDSAGRQSQTLRPDGKTIGYQHDADSNTSSITYPDGYSYIYGFDELERMTDVGELAPAAGAAQTALVHYAYNPLSQRISNTFGNGTSTAYGYDAFNVVSSIAHQFIGAPPADGVTVAYTRDFSERRINDSVSVSTYVWHPPAAATTTYQANANNQYTSINGQTLGYSLNGNLLADPTAALGSAAYGFDQKNRLISATNTQHSASYAYDVFSRRAGKTVDGVGTVFVDDGDREIADYDTSGNELSRFVYGLDNAPIIEEPVSAAGVPSDTWYHHVDALGTTLAITDHTGRLLHAYSTSPWGELGGGAVGTPFRFAGMRVDPETLLYYDHARYYSPQQGRFISPDPIGVKGGVDLYAYTGNDPLNGVDLTGLDGSTEGLYGSIFASIGDVFSAIGNAFVEGGFSFGTLYTPYYASSGRQAGSSFFVPDGHSTGYNTGSTTDGDGTGQVVWSGPVSSDASQISFANSGRNGNGALQYVTDSSNTEGVTATINQTGYCVGGCQAPPAAAPDQMAGALLGFGLNFGPLAVLGGPEEAGGYASFRALKAGLGAAGENMVYHHIVEQAQIKASGFASSIVNNVNNVVAIDSQVNHAIGTYYSSGQVALGGASPRAWLSGQSFEAQFNYGVNVLGRHLNAQ